MHEITTRWAKTGHSVTLICSSFKGARRDEVLDGVRIRRFGNKYTVYFHVFKFMSRRNEIANYDVVFESINTIPFFGPVVSRIPVVAQIYSIDNKGVLLKEAELKNLLPTLCLYGLSSLIPWVYRNCEVTTISEYSRRRLIEEGFKKEKIEVAFPGVSPEFRVLVNLAPSPRRPNLSVVYLGRLKKYKGVQDLIRSLSILEKTAPGVHLLVIGKGDYESHLRSLTRSLGLDRLVTFCGFVSEEEKAALLKSASAYVCTSIDEGGWTISAVEAMSAGVPILVTKSQIDLLAGGTNGLLLESVNASVIADKVSSILRDTVRWNAISRAAADFSKRFDWDTAAEVSAKSLDAAIGRKKDPAI